MNLEHVAALAKLNPANPVFATLDMDGVLAMVDKLSELEVSESDSLDLSRVNVFRPDKVEASMPREDILSVAPAVEAGCVLVPRVVEE